MHQPYLKSPVPRPAPPGSGPNAVPLGVIAGSNDDKDWEGIGQPSQVRPAWQLSGVRYLCTFAGSASDFLTRKWLLI